MERCPDQTARNIALLYALLGSLWILFSDRLLVATVRDPDLMAYLSMVKGWVYVAVTAALLFVLIRRYTDGMRRTAEQLGDRNEELCLVHEELRQQLDEYEVSQYELRESEARFRRLMEQAADAFFVHDARGCFLDANQQACESLGCSREELLGMTIADVDTAVTLEQIASLLDKVRTEGYVTVASVHQRKDGTRFPVEVRVGVFTVGKETRFLSIARDVSERQAMEAALRQREENYRLLFASNPSPMWVYDRETLAFLEVNEAAVKHYGYSREEFLAMTICDIRPSEDVPSLLKSVAQVTKGLDRAGVWRHRKKDGSIIFVAITSHTLEFAGRSAEVVLAGDVTERLQTEAEVLRLNAELEARVKARTAELERANREMEAFSYSVSHDLRAPLRHIDGFSKALLEDYADRLDDMGRNYLHRLRAGAQRMGRLIDDLLQLADVSRSDLDRRPVDLSSLARVIALELGRGEPQRQVAVRITDGVVADCDPRLARVVLENLLGNAWKYSSKRADAAIEFSEAVQEGQRVYVVRDNGVGFDMAYYGKLFQPFQRLHGVDEFEGTGIGLATVRRVVERHGGRVWAEATLGSGAAFYFTFGTAYV